jgi:tetratricopeptide (TPR) repeat protein
MDAVAAGPYELVSKLGDGPEGAVFVARREGAAFRVKLVEPEADARARARILADARTRVEHPIILPVLEAGEEGERLWFATPLVEGSTTLRKRLADGSLTSGPALELVAKLASAVAAAHEVKLLHRDLKPENVILDEKGEPYLGEFGLTPPLVAEAGFPENASYLAPEQVNGTPALVDVRTDVWALGAILHELLAGTPAFPGPPVDAARRIRLEEPAEIAARDPKEHDALAIVARCLEKDRSFRYQSADELAQDCRRALRGEPILAVRPSTAARRWRVLARKPWLLAAVAALSALLALVLAVAAFRSTVDRARLEETLRGERETRARDDAERHGREATQTRDALAFQIRALVAEAREAIARDEAPESLQKRLQAIVALDGTEDGLVAAASLAQRAELAEDAKAYFAQAARAHPGRRGLLGLALWKERHGEDPAETWSELVARTKDEPEGELALIARAAREPDHAAQLLKRAAERKPSALVFLRLAQASGADTQAALAALEAAREQDALDPEVHVAFARLHRTQGKTAVALADADRALGLAPRNALAHLERALALAELGKPIDAEEAADRALSTRPDLAVAHVLRARAHPEDRERAAAELRRALELDPREPWALVDRSALHLERGENADALVDAKAATEAAPLLPEAFLARSRARERLGERTEAASDLRRALELWRERAPPALRAHLDELEKK